MKIPALDATIDRRILVNYRVDPDRLQALLPEPFRPQLVDGHGVAGVCLIRLINVRPHFLPGRWGLRSENAAHRIAVELPDGGRGVYIPRRDTDSRLTTAVGGRLFPGEHHHAEFVSQESADRLSVSVRSDDGETSIDVVGHTSDELGTGSVFADLAAASAFFEAGSLGYSATRSPGRFDGLELHTTGWQVEAFEVERVQSSFFDDEERFPNGSAVFDNALLMRNIDHQWLARSTLSSASRAPAGS